MNTRIHLNEFCLQLAALETFIDCLSLSEVMEQTNLLLLTTNFGFDSKSVIASAAHSLFERQNLSFLLLLSLEKRQMNTSNGILGQMQSSISTEKRLNLQNDVSNVEYIASVLRILYIRMNCQAAWL